MTLRLHLHPGTSSLAPHMALLATNAEFELSVLDLFRGEHRSAEFMHLNPFGTVPVLEDGADVIPETGAILLHVAERFPEARLLPRNGGRPQALRWLFHAAAIHGDFMTWRRASFALKDDPHSMAAVQAWMAQRLASAFKATEQAMTGPLLSGRDAGAADLYMLMVAGWWSARFDFAAETPRLAAALQLAASTQHARRAYALQGGKTPCFLKSENFDQAALMRAAGWATPGRLP